MSFPVLRHLWLRRSAGIGAYQSNGLDWVMIADFKKEQYFFDHMAEFRTASGLKWVMLADFRNDRYWYTEGV